MIGSATYDHEAKGPLDGVRVLDLSRLVSGNQITHVLADLGADVIKVEKPGPGDDLRSWRVAGVSTHWKVYGRGKKSLALNLRDPRAVALVKRLAGEAQALVENFIPGTLETMGLGPDVLFEVNPKLVVVRVSGWGQTGPFNHKPGFGTLVEAMSGFAAMNGFADRPPVLPPLALADMITGLYGATALLTALREVEVKGGRGQVIDLSLFESIHSVLGPQAANYALTGEVPERTGSRSKTTAPRNVYRCKDGKYVALSASMQSMTERLLRTIGRPELIDDPRFRTNADRVANIDAIDAIVAEDFARYTQAENLERFEKAGVTVGPVADIADLMAHPYIAGRAVLASYPDADMERLPMHHVVPRLSRTPGVVRHAAPAVGEHSRATLKALGLDDGAIDELIADGVVGEGG